MAKHRNGLSKTQAKSVAKIAKKVVNRSRELKAKDTQFNAQVGDSPSIVSISDIANGDGINQREGDAVDVKGIYIRGNVLGIDNTNICRLIIFRWMGGPTLPTEILAVGGTNASALGSLNITTNKGNVQTLYDKMWFTSNNTQGQGTQGFNFVKYINFKSPLRQYFSTTTSTSQTKGRILVYMLSDSTVSSHPTFQWYARIRYLD